MLGGNMKTVCTNPIANFQYFLLDKYEAGIVLSGDEIKSIRDGHISIKESFVKIIDNEVWLKNAYIKYYDKSFFQNHKSEGERCNRKLLLHKNEILRIKKSIEQEGLTLIPTKVYFKDNFIKVEIAVARGKKLYDKRETLKKRDVERKLSHDNI